MEESKKIDMIFYGVINFLVILFCLFYPSNSSAEEKPIEFVFYEYSVLEPEKEAQIIANSKIQMVSLTQNLDEFIKEREKEINETFNWYISPESIKWEGEIMNFEINIFTNEPISISYLISGVYNDETGKVNIFFDDTSLLFVSSNAFKGWNEVSKVFFKKRE